MLHTERFNINRVPKRAHYDQETIYKILDSGQICHIAFVHNGRPVVIPTIYGRKDNYVYIHGATVSRMLVELSKGVDMAMSVVHVDGLVLARSAFHHSMNYRSVVVFGKATLVDDSNKMEALKIISDHLLPGRWEEVRGPNSKESKATSVLQIAIEEASAKVRTGDPVDDEEDYELEIWAGVMPYTQKTLTPIPDKRLKDGIGLPESVKNYFEKIQNTSVFKP